MELRSLELPDLIQACDARVPASGLPAADEAQDRGD